MDRPQLDWPAASTKGNVRWHDAQPYLTEALRAQTVALAQRDDANSMISFRRFDLAVVSDRTNQIGRSRPTRSGHVRA